MQFTRVKLSKTYHIEFSKDLELELGMGPGPDTCIELSLNMFLIFF